MYEYWKTKVKTYYLKPKYGNNVKLCYIDTDSTRENKRSLCRPCKECSENI